MKGVCLYCNRSDDSVSGKLCSPCFKKAKELEQRLYVAEKYVFKSHHIDKCNNRNGQNCNCGKFKIEKYAENRKSK